jgi:multiple sugar transport system substrate-binding protein
LPRWAASGRIEPVPPVYASRDSDYNWTDLLPDYREQLLVWDRSPCGLPLLGEAPLCCYRADRLAEEGAREDFRRRFGHDLGPPATWEQFAQVAEFFRDRDRAPSLPPLPTGDRALDRLFYTVAAGYARRAIPADEPPGKSHRDEVFSFHYDLRTGAPRVGGPGFVHALGVLARLQKCRPPGTAPAPPRAFLEGRAVLCLADASWLPFFQAVPALRDKVGICRMPGGDRVFPYAGGPAQPVPEPNRVPYLGGAGWLAVVPGGNHTAAAFDLLADLTGSQTGGQMALSPRWGGGPVRESQLRRERWDSYDLEPAEALKLKEVLQDALLHRGLKNPVLCLRTPREASHREALVAEVRVALQGGKAPARALADAAAAWERLDREQGLEAHRADYHLSLGLLAHEELPPG